MIDIRYFLARQNARRKEVSAPPNESTLSPTQPESRNTAVSEERTVLDGLPSSCSGPLPGRSKPDLRGKDDVAAPPELHGQF
jgi:hypothetical protein